MKKLLLTLAVLCGTVSGWAQINYGKKTWTFPATDHALVTEVPAKIFADFKENNKDNQQNPIELTPAKVGVYTTMVRVNAGGNVTLTFQYNGGNIRMDISGIDLVNAEGTVIASDYHFGWAGSYPQNNTYTVENVAVGDYTLRIFVAAQKEDITSATTNDSKGTITLSGAWLYPNGSTASAKNLYYIKNVKSGKYASSKGEGKQFVQQQNVDAGSYWYFVEAGVEDMKNVESIPEGFKAYWLYNVSNELPVENPTAGLFAAVDASPWPGKIYYVGVHTNDVTGLVLRPYNEDGASWNNLNGWGQKVGHYSYNDPGSLWTIEVANMTEAELIADATTAKNNALTSLTNVGNAYYYNSLVTDAAKTEIEEVDVTTLEKACLSLIDASVDAIVAKIWENSNIYITPAAGDRFIMKNKGRSGYLRAYTEGNVRITNLANDVFALDLVWTLVATGTEGEFKLYNERQGVYVGILNESDNEPTAYTTNVEEAGVYEISQNGIYTLFHAKGQNDKGYLHQSNHGDNKIVRWDTGDASQWQLFKAPFELTTDPENPICYAIRSGRNNNFYFALDANKVKLFNNKNVATDTETHWFFMLDADKNLKIYPYSDKGNPMGYITVTDEKEKLTNDKTVTNYVGDTYTLYFNETKAADYNNTTFAFRPTVGNTFVSHFGGEDNYMGFYNKYDDGGTRVAFEAVSYHVLKQKVEVWKQYLALEGNGLGQYVISDDAKDVETVLQSSTSNNDDFTTLNAIAFPTINLPEAGKFYYLKNGETYLSNVKTTTLTTTAEKTVNNIFYLEEDNENTYLLSYQNGQYVTNPWNIGIGEAAVNGHATERYKQTKTILEGAIGKYVVQYQADNGNKYYFTASSGVTNSSTEKNNNTAQWSLEEVTTLPVTITSAGYATFYSPVAVTLPNGLTAYYVSKTGNGYATLTDIKDNVVPANTGVLLYADVEEPTTYNLTIGGNATEVTSLLAGTVASTYVDEESYVLSAQGNPAVVGFYKAAKNQQNNQSWLNNGFKAYLPANGNNARALVFDFGTETAIESIESVENNAVVYDLAGRRVQNAQKGIFIVNGKKVIK